MEWIQGSVVAPKGFHTYATACGIKKEGLDLAIIYSDNPCHYAGVFTRNVVKAAPVIWNMDHMENDYPIKAVVINSGNANACTGQLGKNHAYETANCFAKLSGSTTSEVLLASTGVIGVPLEIDRVKKGIEEIVPKLTDDKKASDLSAKAILTTDTYTKQAAVTVEIDGVMVTIGGMAKGSGMIHPNMGTMLSFITTDANIEKSVLQRLLKDSVDNTYNMISVDGDTSTNDMVTVLANGMAGNKLIDFGTLEYKRFEKAFGILNERLAKMIAADGEGATKLIEVQVEGLCSKDDARKMVHALISSSLVKTAFFGEDPNWGRILCAMGYSDADFDPCRVDLNFYAKDMDIELMRQGEPVMFDEKKALDLLAKDEIKVIASCHNGIHSATGWGCDLSHDYIKINGSYRT